MFQSKGLISQVAMVESKADTSRGFKKKTVNLPAAIFNRSPIRDQEKPSLFGKSTTPSRKSSTMSGASPLKSRRQESVILNENLNVSNSSLQLTKKSQSTRESAVCQNHETKVAKFMVLSDDENLPYCEKCAILLASQGFKVMRMETEPFGQHAQEAAQPQNPLDLLINHPRRSEVVKFVSELQKLTDHLNKQKNECSLNYQRIEQEHEQQRERVDGYYRHLMEVLESHRQSVIQQLEMSKAEAEALVKRGMGTIEECVNDCNTMKEDIFGAIEVIRDAEERAFRPVMQNYKEKLTIFRQTSHQFSRSVGVVKQVVFNDVEQVGKRLAESIQMRLQEPDTAEDMPIMESQRQSSVYFSFDNQAVTQSNRKSQQENPVLQQSSEEQRLLKSSMMKKGSRTCFEQYEEEE